jgi:hypothetical protein
VFEREGATRKRRRAEDPPPEAIPLLPVTCELSAMFDADGGAGGKQTVLEKIAGEDCWQN